MRSLKFDIFFLAAKRSGISPVFQWHISIRNIHLIIINFQTWEKETTAKSHEDITTFRLKKKGSLKFNIFFLAAECSGILHVFQWHISIWNIHKIITKLDKELDLGDYNNTAKSHDDITTFRFFKKS